MKKVAKFVLKCVALGLIVGAAVCAVVAYWDKIVEAISVLVEKIKEKCPCCASEYDDYADFDDWGDADVTGSL